MQQERVLTSVAEPPLSLAAPAPEVLSPGADQIGSAPARGKKRRLQAAPAPNTNIFHFEFLKSVLIMQVFFGSYLPLQTAFKSCFVTTQGFPFCLPKRCSRSRIKKGGSGSRLRPNKKFGSGSTLKVEAQGGSGSLTLVLTKIYALIQSISLLSSIYLAGAHSSNSDQSREISSHVAMSLLTRKGNATVKEYGTSVKVSKTFNMSQLCHGWVLNPRPPHYEKSVLTSRPERYPSNKSGTGTVVT